jgi:hypothetical protein
MRFRLVATEKQLCLSGLASALGLNGAHYTYCILIGERKNSAGLPRFEAAN